MAKWLPGFGRKQAQAPKTVLELMVLEGADAGQQFTVDGEEVRIGRGKPKTGQTGAILLCDKSVSGHQATIRSDGSGSVLEHNPDATNATLVNGRRIKRQKIKPGDRIQMGLVKIEVRQRQGIALSGLFRVSDDATEPIPPERAETAVAEIGRGRGTRADAPTLHAEPPAGAAAAAAATDLEATTLVEFRGRVVLLRGVEGLENQSFPLGKQHTVVGRSAHCDLTLPEPGISRQHLRFEWDGDALMVVHLSKTNSTCVNRVPVKDRRRVRDGDRLLLADQVELRVELAEAAKADGSRHTAVEDRTTIPPPSRSLARPRTSPDVSEADTPPPRTLQQIMEEKLERDRLIEEQFAVVGSFVDIDVVGSYKMKADAERPAHIIVSFERFRSFVGGIIQEFGGQVLNSNGDELMCFFETTFDAVRSASAILTRLDDFNATQNVLSSPFRFRIGIHTGRSLVDRERGVAYSEVLDIAGHLQKAADVNGLFVSQSTLDALPEGLPFEEAGILADEGIPMYRATAAIA